jgi:Fe2+ or Zn2+ uptake regulation protein
MSEGYENERSECDHEWKPVEEIHRKTHIKLICRKCGATKEIELFP